MKKILALILTAALTLGLLAGCGSTPVQADDLRAPEKKLQIVTTIFPEFDWVMNILGNQAGAADVTMLLDNGVDLHSYQHTVDDIVKISACDLFI